MLTEEKVKKIANLAMLNLSRQEIKDFTKQLTSILEYVKILDEIDVSKIFDQSHSKLSNILRLDQVTSSLTVKESLSNRNVKSNYFTINSVFEDDCG